MKIKTGVFAGIALILVATFLVIPPLANGQTVATTFFEWVREEFQRVWTAIADLNIKAKQPHLVDANGQDLGVLMDSVAFSRTTLTTFSSGYFVEFYQHNPSQTVSWRGGSPSIVYFDDTNCIGDVYLFEVPGPGYFIHAADRFFDVLSFELRRGLNLKSHFDAVGQCVNESSVDFATPAKEISNPFPFTNPVAWPLRIENR